MKSKQCQGLPYFGHMKRETVSPESESSAKTAALAPPVGARTPLLK